jgi:imidazolonepropionase-like amidohydrolase
MGRFSGILLLVLMSLSKCGFSQNAMPDSFCLLKADRLFDGETMHEAWAVLVHGNTIVAAGPAQSLKVPANTKILEYPGCTLLPGLIEGHSHLFLHPYNETTWDDQVLKESRAERVIRATVHARNTLMAGFTTVRDLGTEGAGYDDVNLKHAIESGIVPGPRILAATRAIVATGSYGPKNLSNDISVLKGAAEADGEEGITREVRTQIGKGADLIKLYADYGWGKDNQAEPTFTVDELKKAVEVAASSGRIIAVHSTTEEGMRRSILAGVTTIEHGDHGTPEIFKLMKEKNIALCPTLAAGEAIETYRGWKKGTFPEPRRITEKKKTFKEALDAGVTICMGGDVGVYAHGDNAREMEDMVEYGMKPIDVLRSSTSINADVFRIAGRVGRIKEKMLADIIIVDGDPSAGISQVRHLRLIMKDGVIYKN